MKTDNEILEGVLAEFSALAQYPRPSHHEKGQRLFSKALNRIRLEAGSG